MVIHIHPNFIIFTVIAVPLALGIWMGRARWFDAFMRHFLYKLQNQKRGT